MKISYAVLCVFGAALPYYFFIIWLMRHGLNIELLFSEIIDSRMSSFAWTDIVVSAITLILFIVVEGQRQGMKYTWVPVIGTCTIGVSLGLPLFLLMRELHIAQQNRQGT